MVSPAISFELIQFLLQSIVRIYRMLYAYLYVYSLVFSVLVLVGLTSRNNLPAIWGKVTSSTLYSLFMTNTANQ